MIRHPLKIYTIFCFLWTGIWGLSYAQDLAELYSLYEARKMVQLEQRLATMPNNAGQIPDIVFFRTIFNENGEEALKVYEQLFEQSDGLLKKITAHKLAQYYYARGYYVKAGEFTEIAQNTPAQLSDRKINITRPEKPLPANEPAEALYAIQVGAFSYRDNAQKMLDLLNQQRLNARIVTREINGKALFCVWITGKDDPDETNEYARDLKRKYNIPYRIVKTQ